MRAISGPRTGKPSMHYSPMLARPAGREELKKPGYIYEPKLDGTRAVCYKDGGGIRLINRRGNDITARYPEFSFAKEIKAASAVLDGEVVVYDKDGNPDFHLLQRREQAGQRAVSEIRSRELPASYIVFDILEKDGKSLTDLPLSERKKILDETVIDGKHIQKIFYTENGPGLWEQIEKRKLEGVIGKDRTSEYYTGVRAPVWIKIKYLKTIDCVIVGYTSEKRIISALALAVYSQGKLRYIGRTVGKGFTEEFLKELHKELVPLEQKEAPVTYVGGKDIHWLKPKLVCEVSFLELSHDIIMRAPVFLRMRYDKLPEECVLEEQIVL
jgi:bifunctional non-homologous end joining protein LigD